MKIILIWELIFRRKCNKKETVINIDRHGKGPNINLIDNRHVEIDGQKLMLRNEICDK